MSKRDSLILNSPYSAPSRYWELADEGQPLKPVDGRRPAGYMIADPTAKPHRDRGEFIPLPLVNSIRKRVDDWRNEGYPGVTGVTKKLLEHWQNKEHRNAPLFFCQIEAIETLIWLIETPASAKVGVKIPNDGGKFQRLCSKLATGTGKTVVMAMLIAWQTLNRTTYPKDERFSRHFFIVAPNLTVRERLAVLLPKNPNNYYDEFDLVPSASSLREKLQQAKILIRNWHVLNWETEAAVKKKKGVDKRGAKSDEAYVRAVLGEMATARNLVVINDEAHHAWRISGAAKLKGVNKEDIDEATKWIGGLDRIHKNRGILQCFDFSATPFTPGGFAGKGEALFEWIVSDFGLSDAIEAGLVKTPRVVVRDNILPDAQTYKPRLYHIFSDPEVKDDLNRKAEPHERLPDLVNNAYALLGSDWLETKNAWNKGGTPPVMITVANRTETAARIKYAFDNNDIPVSELCDSEGILHIDSKVLKKAEEIEPAAEERKTETADGNGHKLTQKEQANALRRKVNTVGRLGAPGEKVQNVISVGMLSEGWDARTVTQIMGLRAFTSQLLCEQVIGRGLRRASYEINENTGLFDAEYVNVFGVPFSFLPHASQSLELEATTLPAAEKITIEPVKEKKDFAIRWPNVIRIDRTYSPQISIDWNKVEPWRVDASQIAEIANLAPTVDGKPDFAQIRQVDLETLLLKTRRQTTIFKMAQSIWKNQQAGKKKDKPALSLEQLIYLAESFFTSDRIVISPPMFNQDEKRRRLIILLKMSQLINYFLETINRTNTEKMTIVLDNDYPIRSTGDMRPWRTGKPCEWTKRSHINYCVYDSTWEASDAFRLEQHEEVKAWVKNDHLNLSILYTDDGIIKKYYPDFLIRMKSGKFLVLETKGQQTARDDIKQKYMEDWVKAVSEHGGFGEWRFKVARQPGEIRSILDELSSK